MNRESVRSTLTELIEEVEEQEQLEYLAINSGQLIEAYTDRIMDLERGD